MRPNRYTKKALYIEVNKRLALLGLDPLSIDAFNGLYKDKVYKAVLRPFKDYYTETKTRTLYFRHKALDKILDKIKTKHLKTVK